MAEQKVIIDNVAVPISETKVTFGAVNSITPPFAKWIFRGTLLVTSVLTIWVAATALISEPNKLEIILVFKALDALAFGLSKMFGITLDENK